MPELDGPDLPHTWSMSWTCLVDSSNMAPHEWERDRPRPLPTSTRRFDGFVVLHGTDTLAYTASALSFMLEGLGQSR